MPVAIKEVEGILLFEVSGLYSLDDMGGVARYLAQFETEGPVPDRIFDLSRVDDFGVNYLDVSAVAKTRVAIRYKNPYLSAFVTPKPLQQGFTRMFFTLAANPSVEFASFPALEQAISWVKTTRGLPPSGPKAS